MTHIGGRTAMLHFEEGTLLAEDKVRVSLDMTMDDFMHIQGLVSGIAEESGSEQMSSIQEAFEEFGNLALLSWTLTHCQCSKETRATHWDGGDYNCPSPVPIPADGKGMRSLPMPFANEIFAAWGSVVSDVSPNSSAVSVNGASEAVASEQTAA